MALPIPRYLQVPGIQDATIHYTWDDWDVEASDMPLKRDLQARLNGISHRGIVAFTIGTAEWIIHRFGQLSDDPSPRQYLEAAWAQVVDFNYSDHSDVDSAKWTGPVRGPMGVAIRRVKFAVQQADVSGDPAWRAGRASNLAEHVIAEPEPFRVWRQSILERFTRLYPIDPNEKLGEVVPWQALESREDFNPENTEALINQFLARLDWNTNPFLNSPQKMLRRGFKGTPYSFDIELDRKARVDW
jgi:hypothetical protein